MIKAFLWLGLYNFRVCQKIQADTFKEEFCSNRWYRPFADRNNGNCYKPHGTCNSRTSRFARSDIRPILYIKAVGQIETSFEEEQDIKALINSIENISEREKELYSLYYEVMTQYSQDMTDIVYLTNEYLKRIESSDEFTQKERIYFALTIVVNSAHYWQEFDL